MNITLSLNNGAYARIKVDGGYDSVDHLRALMDNRDRKHHYARTQTEHFTGQDGSDIYLRPGDITMIAVDV